MTNIPQFKIADLLEAGVHFGHKKMRWNPKMAPYIYGIKNGIHIIDLQQTAPLLHEALKTIYEVAKKNGKILFVGTKRQASKIIAEAATRCGQYYVNNRWLGGMLTNWGTISESIKTLQNLEAKLASDTEEGAGKLTKKEKLQLSRQIEKLESSLGGIRKMSGKPDLIFIIDTNKESIAITEAKRLSIPVIAVVDSNSNPDNINIPIPGNDDASKSIQLYCSLVSDAVLAGIQDSLVESGVDLGASEGISITDHGTRDSKEVKGKKSANKADSKEKLNSEEQIQS